MHRFVRRMAVVRVVCVSAFVSLVGLAGQVSQAAADTFNWNVQINWRSDWSPSGGIGSTGPITPIDFAWSFEFDPVVFDTEVQDNQPTSLRMVTNFVGSGVTSDPTPLTSDIWTNMPAGATFTHSTTAFGAQAYSPCANCGTRQFGVTDRWVSNDVDADPNVETTYEYHRGFGAVTMDVTGFGDVEMFDGTSIIQFLAMAGNPGYDFGFVEYYRVQTKNHTTGETTVRGSWWNGQGTFSSHEPSPTPVPEPASMALVATGLLATVIRKRARLW
jgi:hypothetical protein